MTVFPDSLHPLKQDTICKVMAAAERAGLHAYLVGGYLRDALLGRYDGTHQPQDFDFAIAGGQAVVFAQRIADEFEGHFVMLDESCDTARVVLDSGIMLDFAGLVGGTIETDMARRDFTINALCWDPSRPDEVIDITGGLVDLPKRLIRAVCEKNLAEDPLRMLRAFRFATTLSGTIDHQTLDIIKKYSSKLGSVASERISHELFLLLQGKVAAGAIQSMADTGLLEILFPELTDTRRVTPNAFHHLGLFEHSLELVFQAERIIESFPTWALESFEQQLAPGVSRLAATKLACLLHDIGKPSTWQILPSGRHTFYGHDLAGAQMIENIAQRLRWSRPTERFVFKLIRWHLRPGALFHDGPPTLKAVHRFYRKMSREVPELMLLAFADLSATCGPELDIARKEALSTDMYQLLNDYPAFVLSEKAMPRLLDGHQIMKLLDISSSQLVGELIEALTEAQGLGEVSTRQQAERFLIDNFQHKQSN